MSDWGNEKKWYELVTDGMAAKSSLIEMSGTRYVPCSTTVTPSADLEAITVGDGRRLKLQWQYLCTPMAGLCR